MNEHNTATAGKSPDAKLIRECGKYVAAVAAYEKLLIADVQEERRAELLPLRAKQDRAGATICKLEATTAEGQRALAAAIDIDTRDDGWAIQGRAVEFIDILLRGLLGDDKLTPTPDYA